MFVEGICLKISVQIDIDKCH